jgi:plasmid stabilization system protein ParE
MIKYKIVFSDEAASDIAGSFEWGRTNWGEDAAIEWYLDLKSIVSHRLGTFPESGPEAPDSEDYEVEVRQLLVGRYRVLYNIEGSIVTILHVKGAFKG